MSLKVLNQAWRANLPPTAKLVLLALADHADKAGQCWPQLAGLVAKTGLSRRGVQYALGRLAEADHLTRTRHGRRGYSYWIHPRPAEAPADTDSGAANAPRKGAASATHDKPMGCTRVTSRVQQVPLKGAPGAARIRTVNEPPRNRIGRASALKNDWQPDVFSPGSRCAEIVAHWSPDEFADQLEQFKDHHRAKGSLFKDWQAAWRTWVGNSRKFGGRHGRSNDDTGIGRTERAGIAALADLGGE